MEPLPLKTKITFNANKKGIIDMGSFLFVYMNWLIAKSLQKYAFIKTPRSYVVFCLYYILSKYRHSII